MKLTENNIEKWKSSMTKKGKERYDIDDFGDTKSNKEWLEDHEGYSEEEALDEETQYWEE